MKLKPASAPKMPFTITGGLLNAPVAGGKRVLQPGRVAGFVAADVRRRTFAILSTIRLLTSAATDIRRDDWRG